MKRRNKLYTPRDVLLSLMLTIIFILLYLGTWAGCAIVSSDSLSKSIEQLELVEMLFWFWWFFLPVFMILSWPEYVKRYVYLKTWSEDGDENGKSRCLTQL